MKDCSEYKKMLVSFLYGEISPEEERIILEHLGTCKECREDLRELREAREILKSSFDEGEPASVPVVVVEKRESFPWIAALFLLLFLVFLMGIRVKIGEKDIEVSTMNSSSIYEYMAEYSNESTNFQPDLNDYKDYFENTEKGGEK